MGRCKKRRKFKNSLIRNIARKILVESTEQVKQRTVKNIEKEMEKIKGLYNLKNKNIKSKKRNKRGKLLNTSLTMDLININHKRKLYDSITNNNKLIKLHKRYKLNNKLYTKHFNNKISQKIYRKNFFNKLKLNNKKTYKNFTISNINLRSLKRRKEELINYLTKNEIDLMALQETWIN